MGLTAESGVQTFKSFKPFKNVLNDLNCLNDLNGRRLRGGGLSP
jgi:hypothetical protein